MRLLARSARQLPASSSFASLAEASRFFEAGAVGYSPAASGGQLDGLRLCTREWHVEPLDVATVEAAYFTDEASFPAGSVVFDCALIMRHVAHAWEVVSDLREAPQPAVR